MLAKTCPPFVVALETKSADCAIAGAGFFMDSLIDFSLMSVVCVRSLFGVSALRQQICMTFVR